MRLLGWLIVLSFSLLPPGRAESLKLATWNFGWLTQRAEAVPANVTPKRDQDVALLARYAMALNADLIGVQGIDGAELAARVFPPDRYALAIADDDIVQRTGLAIRRDLAFTRHRDLSLDPSPRTRLRSGVDVTIATALGDVRVLVLHLKAGCRVRRLETDTSRDCQVFARQLPPLAAWIAARAASREAFVILGDFGRLFAPGDSVWTALTTSVPLLRATQGHASPCWGGQDFSDHILLGGAAMDWLRPDSLRVLVYRETDAAARTLLSDRCPVSVRLDTHE